MKKALSFLITLFLLFSILALPISALKVTKVRITVDEPKVGEKASYTATLPSTASTKVSSVNWSGLASKDAVFEQGKDYSVIVMVEIKDTTQNSFAARSSINATVNGLKAEIIDGNANYIKVQYTWKKLGGSAPAASDKPADTEKPVDNSPEGKLKAELASLAAAYTATNGDTHKDVIAYVTEKLPGATVWSAGGTYIYRRNLATADKDGFLSVDIGITYNGVTVQKYTFTAVIPALNKSPEATYIAADKVLMNAAFDNFTATSKTTGDDLLAAVNAAAIHGTKAVWSKNYKYTPPTATTEGSIWSDLDLTLGNQKETITSKFKSIPVDGSATDAAIDADEAAVRHAINAIKPTNGITLEKLQSTADTAIKNGSAVKLSQFTLTKATYNDEGRVELKLELSLKGVTRTGYMTIRIPKVRGDHPEGIVTSDEWEILRLVNVARYKEGLVLLSVAPALQDATDIRAEEILTEYSHTRPNGSSCFTAIDSEFSKGRQFGENIAADCPTPDSAFEAWMNSEGHKANILHRNYTYIGVGVGGKYNYKSWVQMFSTGYGALWAESSTGSLNFESVEDMENAYIICHTAEGFDSYLPFDRRYMTKNGNKYTIYLKGKELTVTVGEEADSGTGFSDVPAGAYYVDAVKWAVKEGVTTGTSATTFSPDATCTRGQVVTFLWRAAGKPEPKSTNNPFTDVRTNDYFYKAVLWAVEQNITNGTSATTFSPDATCISAQVITFLYRANNAEAYKESANPYYANAVSWAEKNDLLSGTDTAFDPDRNAPRSDIVYYLFRNSK